MYDEILDLIVEKKWFADIKGITSPGGEKVLAKAGQYFTQGSAIFSAQMVSEITFHRNGCTIVLKH